MSFGQHPKATQFYDLPTRIQRAIAAAPWEIGVWMGDPAEQIRDRLAALRYKFQNLPLLDQSLQASQNKVAPVAPLPDDMLAIHLNTALDQAAPYLDGLVYRAFKLMWIEMAEGGASQTRTMAQQRRIHLLITLIKADDLIAPMNQTEQNLQQQKG
jgi:hypothetical protein